MRFIEWAGEGKREEFGDQVQSSKQHKFPVADHPCY